MPISPRSLFRARNRMLPVIALSIVMVFVATACPLTKAGRKCSGQGWARDSTHILQCRAGKYAKALTFGDYARFLDAVNQQKAAEEARRNSSLARADVMRGTGTWVDVYDWSPTFINFKSAGAKPKFTLDRIDRMRDAGISTLYIQTAKAELPDAVLDRDLLVAIVNKARQRGMRVIGWYLPNFNDPAGDQMRLSAMVDLGLDGIGLDIESTVTELGLRNQRLVELSKWLRATYPSTPLAAIVLPPVVTDVLNLKYWPQFPWLDLKPLFDVWMPMAYWTNRTPASGWRDGYKYTTANIDRVRANLGDPNAVVHAVGGLSDTATAADIAGFVQASVERGAIGASLYDDMISSTDQYGQLAPMAR